LTLYTDICKLIHQMAPPAVGLLIAVYLWPYYLDF